MENPTNQDLLKRIDDLENKVDLIYEKLNQASGAWFFIKILGSIMVGLMVLYNGMHGWFK